MYLSLCCQDYLLPSTSIAVNISNIQDYNLPDTVLEDISTPVIRVSTQESVQTSSHTPYPLHKKFGSYKPMEWTIEVK